MSGINSASSSSSNSSFISDASSSSPVSLANNPATQSPAILNLLSFSRQFTNNSSKLLNFPFCLFPQLQTAPTQVNNMSTSFLSSPLLTGSVKTVESGQLSEELVKQHLSQLIKKQGKKATEFQCDLDNSDIDKNMIYE